MDPGSQTSGTMVLKTADPEIHDMVSPGDRLEVRWYCTYGHPGRSIIGSLPLVDPMVQRSPARISMIWMLQGTGLEYMIP